MASPVDVCFYEAFEEEAQALRQLLPAGVRATYTDLTVQEVGETVPPARLISIRTQSRLPLSWATDLGGVLSRSTGYDHLLAYAAAAPARPALGYLPLYCHRAVAEQALLMWLALLRKLPRQVQQFQSFRRDGLTGGEMAGRVLAVVGVGHIGHEVCTIGRALGMQVLGVDRHPQHADVEYVSIEEALRRANVVVCTMDLNASNRGYFTLDRWQLVQPGTVFVNISRGELSPSTVLLQALEHGWLAGVGLDVYDQESVLATSLRGQTPTDDAEANAALQLSRRDDCLCTPHNAFNTDEAVHRKSDHSVQQVLAFLERGAFLWSPPQG